MQKWEYLTVRWRGDVRRPESIEIWPSGVTDLEWIGERFDVRVRDNTPVEPGCAIDKLFMEAPHVWEALLQYLGINGWELVTVNSGLMFFKRPVAP